MVEIRKNFILDYDEKLTYISNIINYLESKMEEIMLFFHLSSLSKKRKIVVYNDLELYKKHIEESFEYHDYMRADTNDGNINLLSIEEARKTKEHAFMTIEELKSTILHEFVHICQQECEIEHLDHDIVWFWEALATNIGNTEVFTSISFQSTNAEIEEFNSLRGNYPIAFTIGRYLLEKYSHEQILDYVKYPSKLRADSDEILNHAREWSNLARKR